MIVFDHPFNERVRTYLRLESLYTRMHELVAREGAYDHHFALTTLFEILDVAGRPELKTEVLKDLDKQKNIIASYRGNPAIDEPLVDGYVQELDNAFGGLSQLPGRVGNALTENDWLMAVRSRVSIPGGTCSFDLPSYFAWQCGASGERRQNLQTWMGAVEPMHTATTLLLKLIRSSGKPQMMVAPSGVFQQSLGTKTYHLVRVALPDGANFVPETTVNRLLVSVRFVQSAVNERAKQMMSDVSFEMTLC